jgi:tetratricopeptide (TPR) repeat protein
MKRAIFLAFAAGAILSAQCGNWSVMMSKVDDLERVGNYEAAAAGYREVLACTATRNQPYVLNALAMVEDELDQKPMAERHFRRALAIIEADSGANTPDYAMLLGNLGGVLLHQGRRAEAESVMREAIATGVRIGQPDDLRLAICRSILAELLLEEHRIDEAATFLNLAIPVFEKGHQPRHLGMALSNLAFTQHRNRHKAESIETLRRAISVLEQCTSPSHPVMIRARNNLATIYFGEKRYVEAEQAFADAIAAAAGSLGQDHPVTATVQLNYALFLRKVGRKNEAKPLETHARGILRDDARRTGAGMTVDVSAFRSR